MKNTGSLLIIGCIILLSACSGGGKKVLIMSSGKVQLNGNAITASSGGTHTETTLVPDGDNISVVSESGTTNFTVKEPGIYILNLKKDTVVGSYQRTGTDQFQEVITQKDLARRIDSLYLLAQGLNVNEASRNYNIPPFQLSHITNNLQAQIVGPFLKMPGSFDPSKEHEVYKFYTNKEIMEIIDKLKPMISTKPKQ
ncbi:MAG: hypothetical protein JNL51_16180 [Chitinophagaceae bacterium]|nr:hypothetical protein [Chitinophagaceae bacterium]